MINVLILAGGPVNSTRLPGMGNKCLIESSGKSLLRRSVEAFSQLDQVSKIFISIADKHLEEAQSSCENCGHLTFVGAAQTRMGSVQKFLEEESLTAEEFLLIHDGARPFVCPEAIKRLIQKLDNPGCDGAVLACPVVDSTVLGLGGELTQAFDRSQVFALQTPMGARVGTIREARRRAIEEGILDTAGFEDATLIQRYGGRIFLIPSTRENLKITNPLDLQSLEPGFAHV